MSQRLLRPLLDPDVCAAAGGGDPSAHGRAIASDTNVKHEGEFTTSAIGSALARELDRPQCQDRVIRMTSPSDSLPRPLAERVATQAG